MYWITQYTPLWDTGCYLCIVWGWALQYTAFYLLNSPASMPINFLRSQTRNVTLWSGLSDTLSDYQKAFWKSTKVTVTTQLALRTSLHVSVRCINNNTVEYSLRYAHWLSVTRLSFTLYTCEMTVSKTHDSSILLGTLRREREADIVAFL